MKRAIRQYIYKWAADNGKVVPDNYIEILSNYTQLEFLGKVKVKFILPFINKSSTILNAYAPLCNKEILVCVSWAIQILFYDSPETKNTFCITMGHELTHMDANSYMCPFRLKETDRRFIAWINEVYADFGGAMKGANGSREKLIEALKYKLKQRLDAGETDIDQTDHPCMQRRINYAADFDFTVRLIHQIAADTDCKNEQLIHKVISQDKYKEIMLN